jgi:hypothetical protein
MTTGSWSVGVPGANSKLYAAKSWSGSDGKYEVWQGGTRAKWNDFQMTHTRFSQGETNGFGYANDVPLCSINDFKTIVGWTNNDELRALNKLAERIKGHSFDLAINMAEAGKTYGTVLRNLRSIGSGLVALKRGRPADAFRALGVSRNNRRPLRASDISGRWLEMQYGWRPLVDQAYEAGKALEAQTGPRVYRFRASQKKTKLVDLSSSPGFYELWSNASVSIKFLAELYEDVPLARALGLTNPAAVAWEVVPYSFVVDWFLPVGSYLSAWGIIPSLKGRFLTTTRGSWVGCRFVKTSPFPVGRKDSGLRHKHFAMSRSPSGSLSVPRPAFNELPRALSPAHLYNAVALVHQSLS